MALHHVYADAIGSTIDITDRVRFGGTPENAPGDLVNPNSNAEEGSVATWQITIDDPDADLVIIGHRRIYGYEDAAPVGKQVLYNGFVGDKAIVRGDLVESPILGRQWLTDLIDPNSILSRRLGNGADCNRPAETDLERIAWALTTTELNTLDPNADLVDTTGGVAMDACDYRGQPMQQLIDDCSQQSGRNAFVVYREDLDPNVFCLAYMKPTSDLYYAKVLLTEDLIRLTNDASEVDDSIPFGDPQSVFVVLFDPQVRMRQSPQRVYSGVMMDYEGGRLYEQNTTTGDTFVYRDMPAPASNVKTLAKAEARVARYLADAASEEDVISCSFIVPAAQVNDVKPGMRLECKFTHLGNVHPDGSGYDDWTWARVLTLTASQVELDRYQLDVELSPIPPIPCAEFTALWDLPLTPSGFYRPLGGIPPVYASDVLYYRNGGTPTYPKVADHSGDNWSFPVFGISDGTLPAGEGDTAWGDVNSLVDMYIVGTGTVTIHTGNTFGSPGSYDLSLHHGDAVTGYDVSDDLGNFAAGVDAEVVIPDDGHCIHMVRWNMRGTANVEYTVFGGITWAGTHA